MTHWKISLWHRKKQKETIKNAVWIRHAVVNEIGNFAARRGEAIAPFAPGRARPLLCTVAMGSLFLKNNSHRLFFLGWGVGVVGKRRGGGARTEQWLNRKRRKNPKTLNLLAACTNAAACTLRLGTANERRTGARARAHTYALETLYCFGFSPFVEHEHLLLNKMGGLVRSETQWICMRSRDCLILLPSEVEGNEKNKTPRAKMHCVRRTPPPSGAREWAAAPRVRRHWRNPVIITPLTPIVRR